MKSYAKSRLLLAGTMGVLLLVRASAVVADGQEPRPAISGATFDDAGRLVYPERYREWIFLSSGLDMNYGPLRNMGHSMFDNVFVNPSAYLAFLKTGTWPDGSIFILEIRGATNKGSINRSGQFQTVELMGFEAHVKDSKRFAGGWGFYSFDGRKPAQVLPRKAECYACHETHAAVDTTFVQFYPTLIDIARSHGTFKADR